MSVFQTLLNCRKLYYFRKSISLSSAACKCSLVRHRSDVHKKFLSFDEVVAQRRAEARRSLVVQVNSEGSFSELYGYCSKYASINGVHHYKNSGGEHFMLIEFSTEENLKDVIRSCSSHQKDLDVMALRSPFLWFRASTQKKEKFILAKALELATKNGEMTINEDELFEELLQCKTVSEQIQMLHDRTALNDIGVRLRYMVARQIECIFESMYANIAVRPFGSSVNGFGKLGCDLDLVLTNVVTDDMSDPKKRLVFQEKKCEGGRSPWQRHMEMVAETLELRAPGAARVQRILHARVPIVKYCHQLAGVDCDLCYNNMSGVYMSELLWLFGSLDPRVRPLVSAVRRWARAVGLTNPHPGRWITNFPLTLMVLFFLQQKTKDGHVLPSVKTLARKAEKDDIRIAEDNLNCTFLRDLNKLPQDSYGQNTSSLETLLLQFFEFYAQYQFQDKAISINDGTSVRKPNALPLYIVNPLEQALNVSRNVSYEECERLKLEVRNAAWQLEGMEDQRPDDWGLVRLVERKTTRGLKKLLRVGNSQRLVSVRDLFKDDDSPEPLERLKSDKSVKETEDGDDDALKLQRLKSEKSEKANYESSEKEKKEPIKFKNSRVASEVYRIRRDKMV